MFHKLFKENIKLTMNWEDSQFNLFLDSWTTLHTECITSKQKSYLCNSQYFELILSLYFIVLQLDLKQEITNKKSILLSILLFYAATEEYVGRQSEVSLIILSEFLSNMSRQKLISDVVLKHTVALLHSFNNTKSDLLLDKEFLLLSDLILSADPIVVDRKHAMFYYEDPQESTFAVKSPYPTPNQFFDEMFKISRRLNSKLLKGFYVERLHRLMDTQAKKSIFPF